MSNSISEPDGTAGSSPGSSVQSVDRALTIVEILARVGEAGVTEVARELDVHKSTAFRLVATLEAHEIVEQTEDRGKYRLGVGLLRLAGATTARLDLVQEARPLCRQLAVDTGETVNLAVLSGGFALYVDQIAGNSALQSHNWVGQHIPLHATSNGKVLISELPDDRLAEIATRLAAYTPKTITRKRALREDLAQVRELGYAVATDELEPGLAAVAAPIRNPHGDIVASISVSGPTFRLGPIRLKEVAEQVVDVAAAVSFRLGWSGPGVGPGMVTIRPDA